ncbi:MAG: CPBP family intramembrane metalloprotease [Lunatimonas sp.]|uniref:CPBP family intramembrane glutamic endopeptidase n=1 Tax=Lunatimonas sp. TaxID=2060141 RepID=UPI00263B08B1|nr:CPBP family intramembrane glutamic endopeptidase [Lunatimonas sp.]MCC5938122.1 CPBP family intramembrane metalloprotease [Lunatimonas sp.]
MRVSLFWLGLLTLLVFGLLGILVIVFLQDAEPWAVLTRGRPVGEQFFWGIGVGLASSTLALLLISAPFFTKERHYYRRLIESFQWTPASILLVSMCAGVGEELFFRAGLQPLLGIWWTSLIFVALHGYLNPTNWRISVYGALMVGVIAGFGFLFEGIGFWAVAIAHTVFDWVLISKLTGSFPRLWSRDVS